MVTPNANNTIDFGTQFGGTTLTVFDTLEPRRRCPDRSRFSKTWKSLLKQYKKSQLFLLLVRLVAEHLKYTWNNVLGQRLTHKQKSRYWRNNG